MKAPRPLTSRLLIVEWSGHDGVISIPCQGHRRFARIK